MDDSQKSRQELLAELQALREEVQQLRGSKRPTLGQDFLQHVLDSLDTPVFVKNKHLQWVYLNKEASEIINADPDDQLGKSDHDFYPKEHADYIQQWDKHVLATGETVSYERETPLPDGPRHLLSLKSRYTDPATNEPYIVGLLQDITSIRQTQEELHEMQQRLQTILNSSGVGILVLRNNRILFANDTMCRYSGYTKQEASRKSISDFIHPDDIEVVLDNHQKRLKGEDVPEHYMHRILSKDGSTIWVSNSARRIQWDEGTACLHFIVEMTELKKAQDELAVREKRTRQIIDLVPHLIYARHEDGRFIMANAALAEAYGTTVEEMIHTPPQTALAMHKAFERLEWDALRHQSGPATKHIELTDKAGSTHLLECTALPFTTFEHQGQAVLGVCNDITRRETMRSRLESLNDCLLNFGSEPTANISSLVSLCGEMLKASYALYYRFAQDGPACASAWNPPPGLSYAESGTGSICGHMASQETYTPILLSNLQESSLAQTDANIARLGLQSCFGITAKAGTRKVGVLYVAYRKDFSPTLGDSWLLGAAAAAIGVEEHRAAALESMRNNNRTLRAMFNATDAQMLLVDPEHTILLANNAAAEFLNSSPDQLAGKQLESVFPPDQLRVRHEALRSSQHSGKAFQLAEHTSGREFEHNVYPVATDAERTCYALHTRDRTMHRQAERQLQESEERFRTTFEQAAVGMAHISTDGRWLRVNDKLCDILGYSRRELNSMRIQDITHPEDLDKELRQLHAIERGRIPSFSMEKRFTKKAGEECWVNFTASCIHDEDMTAKYHSCVVEDISLRKAIERALLRRDAVLEAVGHAAERFLQKGDWTNHINDVLESLGTAAMTSRAYMFRNSRDEHGELTASQVFEWVAPGVKTQLHNPDLQNISYDSAELHGLKQALSQKQPFYGKVAELSEADRAILEPQDILSIAVVPVYSEGAWWGFIGFDDCRTERDWMPAEIEALVAAADIIGHAISQNRMEKALKESERKFRIIAEAVDDVFWISTPDREKSLYVSPALNHFATARNRLAASPDLFYKLIHPDDRSTVKKLYSAPSHKTREIEYRVANENGGWTWVHERAYPVYSQDGQLEWLAGIISDITERRRTAEQIHCSLREKELLLQEVHHRVKNNLQIITSLLDMADRRISDPHAREIMRDTQSKVQSMAMIHLQLYGHERFDRIDMANYARMLTSQLSQMYNAQRVAPNFDMQEITLPLSQAIPCGLVLSEALANAFKHAFTAENGGTLTLSIRRSQGDILISVADNGTGIEGHCEATQKSVGMKLIKNIVHYQLNGTIDITSENGTTVTVCFPQEEQGVTQ